MKHLLLTTRHAIRTITAFFFVATVALLVAAVLLRSFGEIRLQLLLTFIGFGFGGTLLNLLLDCYSENRPVVILGSVALGVSLTFYLLLVWDGLRRRRQRKSATHREGGGEHLAYRDV